MESKRKRELLASFTSSSYNLVMIYNPHCKEETERIFIFSSYTSPRPGILEYTIKGQDITDLIKDLQIHSFEIPGKMDLGLSSKIESLPSYTYVFSPDYSMELIRQ